MKFRWFDRVFLTLFTLTCMALGAGLIFIALMPYRLYGIGVDKELIGGAAGQIVLTAIGVFVFLGGLRYLFTGARGARKGSQPTGMLLRSTENGAIRISAAAMDALVQKCVKKHAAVRDVQSRIIIGETGEHVSVALRITLMPDAKAPEVCEALQSDVKANLQEMAGVNVQEVRVYVEAPPAPNARVE